MDTYRLRRLEEALDALEEACGLLHRLDTQAGLNEEQERIFVSLRYEYDKLCDETNKEEELLSYDYEEQ